MIPQKELNKVIDLAKTYHIGKLYLVGSALYKDPEDINDYDFVVENVPSGQFFPFYGKVIMSLSKPVDLILLTNDGSRFEKMVREEAELIYEQKKA